MNIAILLSTYNGSSFLANQLDSLFSQTYGDFEVFVRDDGSTDNTLSILRRYPVHVIPSERNLGSKNSFATLLLYAIENSNAEYFMFCDQDDVWYEGKVEESLNKIQEMEGQHGSIPILVHTDLEVVDLSLKTISESMWRYEYIIPNKNSLSRLLLQNTVTGCTVIINRKLAWKSLSIPECAIMHDWWIGLVASYFGEIGFINKATIKYRQHGGNTIGAKKFRFNFFLDLVSALRALFLRRDSCLGDFDANMQQAKSFLEIFESDLDNKTKKMLNNFIFLRDKGWISKRVIIFRYKLIRQGFIRNFSLLLRV